MFSGISSSPRLALGEWCTWWDCSAWGLGSPRGWPSSSPPSRCLCLVSGCISRPGIEPALTLPPGQPKWLGVASHLSFRTASPDMLIAVCVSCPHSPPAQHLDLLTGLLASLENEPFGRPSPSPPAPPCNLLCYSSPS